MIEIKRKSREYKTSIKYTRIPIRPFCVRIEEIFDENYRQQFVVAWPIVVVIVVVVEKKNKKKTR